jgi:hypothetical protein
MINFFDASTVAIAQEIFIEIRRWLFEGGFPILKRWWAPKESNLLDSLSTIKNF